MPDYGDSPAMTLPRVITNHHRRATLDASELSQAERETFDYLPWDAIDNGTDSAYFFRYRGELHDLGEFMRTDPNGELFAQGWQGMRSDSFFSGLVVSYTADDSGDAVIVGLYLS